MFSLVSLFFVIIYSFLLYTFIFEYGIYDLSCDSMISRQSFTFVGLIIMLAASNFAIGVLNLKYEKSGKFIFRLLSLAAGLLAAAVFVFSLFGFYIDFTRPPACEL